MDGRDPGSGFGVVMEPLAERRRGPRTGIQGHTVSLVRRNTVRVVEISPGGALLACNEEPPVGPATLRLQLASMPFTADVEVRYSLQAGPQGHAIRAGTMFVRTTGESREALDRFLAKADRRKRV